VDSGGDIVVPGDSGDTPPTRWQRYRAWNDRAGAKANRWVWFYIVPIGCLLLIIMAPPPSEARTKRDSAPPVSLAPSLSSM
jgi:hypothetical protein